MAYAKDLREKLPRLADEMTAIVNKAKTESNRGLTSEEREKFHTLEADYTALEDSIKISEKTTSIVDDLAKAPGAKITETQIEQLRDEFRTDPKKKSVHDKAFSNYMRKGMAGLDAEEAKLMNFVPNFQNTMSTTTGSQGGYLVPVGFSEQLEVAKKWFGGIEGTVGNFKTETGNPFNWPSINDTANKGHIIGQNVQVTQTDLVFGQTTFNAYIGSSDLILIPLALMQDSYFDMDGLAANLLGTRLGRLYNQKCTIGTGTRRTNRYRNRSRRRWKRHDFCSWWCNRCDVLNLVDVEHSVDIAYRNNPGAAFMFSDTVSEVTEETC